MDDVPAGSVGRGLLARHAAAPVLLVLSVLSSCSPSGGSDSSEFYARPRAAGGLPPADGSQFLDPLFGSEGIVTLPGSGEIELEDVLVDRAGRILVCGHREFHGTFVYRLLSDGALDPSFGDGGVFEPQLSWQAASLALDDLDRILVGGTSFVSATGFATDTRPSALVLRLLDDGTSDPEFGAAGRATIVAPEPEWNSEGVALVLDGAGAVLLLGHLLEPYELPYISGRPQRHRIFVARLLESGALDVTYGSGGLGQHPPSVDCELRGLALDGAGRALATGFIHRYGERDPLAVWRFAGDGTPDATFGAGGLALLSEPAAELLGFALAPDSSGRILVGGVRTDDADAVLRWPYVLADGREANPFHDYALWRLDASGALDPGFGTGGRTLVNLFTPVTGALGGDQFDRPSDLLLTADGRVILLGITEQPLWDAFAGYFVYQGTQVAALRFLADGTLDPSFNGGGIAVLGDGFPAAATLDIDGALVTAGGREIWKMLP